VQRHGYGILTSANGDRFAGLWQNNKQVGPGHILGQNGVEYRGDWVDGKIQGAGTLVITDTDNTITGTFSGDLDSGLEIKQGVFKRGSPTNFSRYTDPYV
jgi:hypothetical protein